MTVTGPKPRPTELKRLQGNPGRRPLNEAEPKFSRPDKVPNAPAFLPDLARKEWKRVARILHNTKVLTEADLTTLAGYCALYARWREAEEMVKTEGMVTITINGNIIQNPYLAVANRALTDLLKFSTELGLTPSSRTRLKVEQPKKELTLAEQLFQAAGIETVNND